MKQAARKVDELREAGYSVAVVHSRDFDLNQDGYPDTRLPVSAARELGCEVAPLPRGGATRVTIRRGADLTVIASGTARCNWMDNFDKGIGLAIALGRAMKNWGAL